jgi:protein-arginine kinase
LQNNILLNNLFFKILRRFLNKNGGNKLEKKNMSNSRFLQLITGQENANSPSSTKEN